MQLPDSDYIPEWAKIAIAALFGAGGVRWFSVYLENRRLARKDFRETLLERIRELEKVVTQLQRRMGNLRVEMAHIEVENSQLRRDQGCPERQEDHNANDNSCEGDDVGLSS